MVRNLMVKKPVALASKMLALVAVVFVSTASLWCCYRPSTPAELSSKQ